MRVKRFWVPLICLAFLTLSCRRGTSSSAGIPFRSLDELDGYVAARNVYETRKRDQLDGIRRMVAAATSDRSRYDNLLFAADEFFSYSFDSTQYYLKQCLDLAERMRDRERYNRAAIRLGHLYAKAGNYMEASNRLLYQIDTNSLSTALWEEYLMALYDFSRDLAGNSGMVERPSIQDRDVYRQRLYQLIPKDSENWRELRMDELVSSGRLDAADSLVAIMLSTKRPDEHKYAIYAYERSVVAERSGRSREQMEWLIKSAESDIINSVKDYASLTMVSQYLVGADLDRSFRYLRIAQEDAITYNAKLRPWQISQFFLEIEDAYAQRQQLSRQRIHTFSILLAILAVMLLVVAWFLVVRSRKLIRMQKEVEEQNNLLATSNATLAGLNKELSRADQVKERYIVDFLRRLSHSVSVIQADENYARNMLKQGKSEQLLKEISLSTRSEKTLKDFYRDFDATFLQAICPDFVDRFNELLREDARFSPRPGSLTTELRIFALIRLGVDDSREIAELLHYSQSTIYNYKVSVKNAALGDRDKFEEQVKKIGK